MPVAVTAVVLVLLYLLSCSTCQSSRKILSHSGRSCLVPRMYAIIVIA